VYGVGRTGAVFGPWLGGILVAGGLSSLGFVVFAIAGLLGAAMVALVRQKTNSATASGPAGRTPVPGTRSA
jgi:AAHS family benzoate transporter-like MFS transporter